MARSSTKSTANRGQGGNASAGCVAMTSRKRCPISPTYVVPKSSSFPREIQTLPPTTRSANPAITLSAATTLEAVIADEHQVVMTASNVVAALSVIAGFALLVVGGSVWI